MSEQIKITTTSEAFPKEENSIHWDEKEIKLNLAEFVKTGEIENPDLIQDEKGNWAFADPKANTWGSKIYPIALTVIQKYRELIADNNLDEFQIGTLRFLVDRLIHDKPIIEITDENADWVDMSECLGANDSEKLYQSSRCTSMFKQVNSDGSVFYSDVDRWVCRDGYDLSNTFHCSVIYQILDKLYPINLPYNPDMTPTTILVIQGNSGSDNIYDEVDLISFMDPITREWFYYKESGEDWLSIDQLEFSMRYYSYKKMLYSKIVPGAEYMYDGKAVTIDEVIQPKSVDMDGTIIKYTFTDNGEKGEAKTEDFLNTHKWYPKRTKTDAVK